MERVLVESSTIKAIGYDKSLEYLEVEFKKGTVYAYYDVAPEVHEALMESKSKNKFVISNLQGKYEVEKIL